MKKGIIMGMDWEKFLGEWEPLIWKAANRYKMPERGIEPDDLFQDACTGLFELSEEVDDITTEAMKASVKGRIWQRVIDRVRPWLTQKRGKGRELKAEDIIASPSGNHEHKMSLFDLTPETRESTPDLVAMLREHVEMIARRLEGPERKLLSEMLEPSEKTTRLFQQYADSRQRRPSQIPLQVFADSIGFSLSKARGYLSRIREVAVEVMCLDPDRFRTAA